MARTVWRLQSLATSKLYWIWERKRPIVSALFGAYFPLSLPYLSPKSCLGSKMFIMLPNLLDNPRFLPRGSHTDSAICRGAPYCGACRYEPPPPPLPPPRYIDEVAAGSDPGWAWGNSVPPESATHTRSRGAGHQETRERPTAALRFSKSRGKRVRQD